MTGTDPALKVTDLTRQFWVKQQAPVGGRRGLWQRHERKIVNAVAGLSFEIQAGERVAFIGPNGAGKSTTIKILTGILRPSTGTAQVLGLIPWAQRSQLSIRIGSVFGQRSQLWYHLPAADSFDLFARVYNLSSAEYQLRRRRLTDLFQLEDLLLKPVRQLSLGERMRCELAATLLHQPAVLLLDEPSIGLDISAKAAIRDLIKRQSVEEGTTLLLTSHDTADMEQVCDRVILINHGRLLLDTKLSNLRRNFISKKYFQVTSAEEHLNYAHPGVKIAQQQPYQLKLEVDTKVTTVDAVIRHLAQAIAIRDITIEDPPLEEILKQLYLTNSSGGTE